MLSKLKDSILTRFIWFLLTLTMLNVSVDTIDVNLENHSEDLSLNDQESIIELVVEQFFGCDDYFAENDDDDSDQSTKKVSYDIKFINEVSTRNIINQVFISNSNLSFFKFEFSLLNGFSERLIHPPNV